MSCIISCVMTEDGPRATVTWDEPLPTGEMQLPVTNMFDDEGEDIDWKNWEIGEPSPLRDALAIVAGPDAHGQWWTIEVKGAFEKMH